MPGATHLSKHDEIELTGASIIYLSVWIKKGGSSN